MGKKLKFKVKKGKLKVKLKSGRDAALPLSEGDIRGLLVLAMASAVGPGVGPDNVGLLAGAAPSLLAADANGEHVTTNDRQIEATSQRASEK